MDADAVAPKAGKSSSSGSALFIVLTVKEGTGSGLVSDLLPVLRVYRPDQRHHS